MKKLVLALSIVLMALLASSCDNSTPKDYNDLTAEQKIMMGEVGVDIAKSLTLISFSSSSNVATAPTGITATRQVLANGDSATIIMRVNYKSYVGSIYGYTLTGTVVSQLDYDSIYDNYQSSESVVVNMSAAKNGVTHLVSSNYEETRDKNTGILKSSVETGTFDGAGYRESN